MFLNIGEMVVESLTRRDVLVDLQGVEPEHESTIDPFLERRLAQGGNGFADEMMSSNVGKDIDVFFQCERYAAYAQDDKGHHQEHDGQQQTQHGRRQIDHRKHLQKCGGLIEKPQWSPFDEIVFFHEIVLGFHGVPFVVECGGVRIGGYVRVYV